MIGVLIRDRRRDQAQRRRQIEMEEMWPQAKGCWDPQPLEEAGRSLP
jgi:hypothetical protein